MPSSTIIGAAGEHYVMCQLLRRDLIAALAPAGVPNADIVVTDKVGDRLFAIQVMVHTDDGIPDAWHMGAKHEEIVSPSVFYSFVDFGGSPTAQPKCWVLPSKLVAKALKLPHRKWLCALTFDPRLSSENSTARGNDSGIQEPHVTAVHGVDYGFSCVSISVLDELKDTQVHSHECRISWCSGLGPIELGNCKLEHLLVKQGM